VAAQGLANIHMFAFDGYIHESTRFRLNKTPKLSGFARFVPAGTEKSPRFGAPLS